MSPKLVRDRIPSIIVENKKTPHFYHANDEEFGIRLKEKLVEEVHEFLESEDAKELADIIEVIEALARYQEKSLGDILQMKKEKALTNGSFSGKIILTDIK
ncbi:nucleoside triphosphate pyrophosphohydrolase [Candidatus Dependentiae bacterium]|nr:nucleoside triphosphate pyrophosphohydrolase [Candidatus Dependentiae bacterium]